MFYIFTLPGFLHFQVKAWQSYRRYPQLALRVPCWSWTSQYLQTCRSSCSHAFKVCAGDKMYVDKSCTENLRSFINHVTVTMVSMVASNWAYKYHTSNIQYNNASSFLITIYTFIRFILKVNVKFIKPSTNRKCMKWADFLSPSNIYNNLISEYLYFTLKAYQ